MWHSHQIECTCVFQPVLAGLWLHRDLPKPKVTLIRFLGSNSSRQSVCARWQRSGLQCSIFPDLALLQSWHRGDFSGRWHSAGTCCCGEEARSCPSVLIQRDDTPMHLIRAGQVCERRGSRGRGRGNGRASSGRRG